MEIQKPKSDQPIPEDAKLIFKGKLFDVYQWEQELFDGRKATYEKLRRPDSVVVFPVLSDNRILLLEQEQPGKDPFIGGPGGRVDPGEDPLTAVKRELLEESGYEASEYILWHAEQPISKIDWSVYIFIAKGLQKVADPDLDQGQEKAEPKIVTLDELIELSMTKRFREKEITPELLKAKIYPEKMEQLKKLFSLNKE